MQLVVSAVDPVGEVAAIRGVGEVKVSGPAWGGKGLGMGGGEGKRIRGEGAGGPVLTVSENFIEAAFAVGVLARTSVPVIDLVFFVPVVAGVVFPAIINFFLEGKVIEDRERVVGIESVLFEGFSSGRRVSIRRLMDQGRDGAAARGEIGDVGTRATETWYSPEDISGGDHETQVMG